MSKKSKKEQSYPTHSLSPEDFYYFEYLEGYVEDWQEMGLGEADLEAVEVQIMLGGKDSPVVSGTSGLRKMRFAPAGWKVGKSGGLRICFAVLEEFYTVLMIFAYSKKEFDDLSEGGKKAIGDAIDRVRKEIEAKQ
jgi:hypothetical protein